MTTETPVPEGIETTLCPTCESALWLVEVQGMYDGGLFYECPRCGQRVHRWPVGDRRRALAEVYVESAR